MDDLCDHFRGSDRGLGSVDGKQGRFAKAIRVVMGAAAVRHGEKIVVEIG